MSESRKNSIKVFHHEIIGSRQFERLGEVLSPDLVYRNSFVTSDKDLPWLKNFLEGLVRSFPDHRMPVEDLLIKGDSVLCKYQFTGTHEGPFIGIPGSGIKVSVPCIGSYKFGGDLIVEITVRIDMEKVRQYMLTATKKAFSKAENDGG